VCRKSDIVYKKNPQGKVLFRIFSGG